MSVKYYIICYPKCLTFANNTIISVYLERHRHSCQPQAKFQLNSNTLVLCFQKHDH